MSYILLFLELVKKNFRLPFGARCFFSSLCSVSKRYGRTEYMLPKDVSSQWWRVWQIPEFLKGFTQSTCKACVNNTQILFACALRTVRGILALYWHDWGCVCWHSSSRRSAINGGDYYTNRFDTVHTCTVITLSMVLMWHNWCGCGWEQGLTRVTAPTTSSLCWHLHICHIIYPCETARIVSILYR